MIMDYGGKLFQIENWLPKDKKKQQKLEKQKKLEKPKKAVDAIEDVNMMMFGFGPDADAYLRRKRT